MMTRANCALRLGRRCLVVAGFVLAGAVYWPSVAHADTYGVKVITNNTTLKSTHHGQIQIKASNVTLDCDKNFVRYDSRYTGGTCQGQTCGIRSSGNDHVVIKHCALVGDWDTGIYLSHSEGSQVHQNWGSAHHKDIWLYDTNGAIVDENDMWGDDVADVEIGIYLQQTSNTWSQYNFMASTTAAGIYDEDGVTNTYYGDTVHTDGVYGFLCYRCFDTWYEYITTYGHPYQGLHVHYGDQGWVHDAYIGRDLGIDAEYGIDVSETENFSFTSNVCQYAAQCDARDDSDNNYWADNTFTKVCGLSSW